ncbi:APO protein 4, mitochondrial [Vitis vinifera]|uniref:APO protein 4, mitochondrial n=1 Tax=Vitis vinifera TaxID=29760 RepID=A0A438G883_VITVI|nr:APO protein 4, mitochondrial [Vitis vinifera]
MALRGKLWHCFLDEASGFAMYARFYSVKVDLKKLRPMILKRIENRAKEYPISSMIPVAQDVLKARSLLIQGVSTLMNVFPVMACKFCPEVYIGEQGHLIQTCYGYKRRSKNQVHEWISGSLNDILVPVETFHLQKMFQDVIKHHQRFDFDRVPAVFELCLQAGADLDEENLSSSSWKSESTFSGVHGTKSLSPDELKFVATGTLRAWEVLRSGIRRLLLVNPAKVCKYCSEVHVGPSGHKARLCGVFKADFYGHAPAVVDLCTKAGAIAPARSVDFRALHLVHLGAGIFTALQVVLYEQTSLSAVYFTTFLVIYFRSSLFLKRKEFCVVILNMKLQVEILTGKFFYIEVGDDGKVADLKRVIGDQENLPDDRLILILYNNEDNQGVLMKEDDTSLVDYGVQDGSLLYLFFSLPPPDDGSIQNLDLAFLDSPWGFQLKQTKLMPNEKKMERKENRDG